MISILFVDDEPTLPESIRADLGQTGEFSVTTCTSAQEALGMIAAASFDVIVAGYPLAGTTGLEFLHRIRSGRIPLPFILFTAESSEILAVEALNAGADYYLRKNKETKNLSGDLADAIRHLLQRKQSREQDEISLRLHALQSDINRAIARKTDLATFLDEVCRLSVGTGRFRMSWVGLLDRESRTFCPVAHAGHEDGYLEAIDTALFGEERSQGPTGTALRNGHSDICNAPESDPRMVPWRDEALKRGYRSFAAFPFRLHGEVVGAYMLYSRETNFFQAPQIAILDEIATDISFALDRLDEQARHTHATATLAGDRQRETALAEALELSSQPFCITGPDGRFRIANSALCELAGYDETELQQMNWESITAPSAADQYPQTASAMELERTGLSRRYETLLLRKNGSTVPVEVCVHRSVGSDSSQENFSWFITDITKHRQEVASLNAECDEAGNYLETAGLMLAAVDPDGTISTINRKGCEILGYPEAELLGRNWITTCLPGRIREEVRGVFGRLVSGELAHAGYHENPVLTKNGEERIIAFHNTLLQDPVAGITGIFFCGEDITARKMAEQEVQDKALAWKRIFSVLGNPAVILDPHHSILEANDAVMQMTGKTLEELRTMKCWQVFHEPGRMDPVSGCPCDRMLQSEPCGTVVVEQQIFGGTYLVACTPVPDAQGRIEKIIHVATDITEQHQEKEALLKTEGLYSILFEKSPDGMVLVLGDRMVSCNPRAERMFGFLRNDIIGQPLSLFSPGQQPGGAESATLLTEYLQEAGKNGTVSFSWTCRRKDGDLQPVQVTLISAGIWGDHIIAIIHDLTGENRAVQQLRTLSHCTELSPDPVIEATAGRDIPYANPAAHEALARLGLPPDPAAFLPDDFELLAPAMIAENRSLEYREVRVGPALFGELLSFTRGDPAIRIYSRDITDRALLNGAREEAIRKLNLLDSMSRHDIRNKLTGVMGYIELAKGSTTDPDLIDYLGRAEVSALAVQQQVEFTKKYQNFGVNPPVWQDLSALIAEMKKNPALEKVIIEDTTAGLWVYADPLLEKILMHLLENSLEYGEHVSRVRVTGTPSPAGFLLVIEDDGVGIPADKKEKIFSKIAGKPGPLGLFLSREILSITGITLEETGEPGKGARFEMSIPAGKFEVRHS